MLDSDWLRTF